MNHGNRRQIISWCLFDFANSSYSAIIAAVIFPVYFVSTIAGGATGQGDLWWGRSISASMAFVAITSPFLGGIADYKRISGEGISMGVCSGIHRIYPFTPDCASPCNAWTVS
ncbi:MAG: Major facilitator superfamily 1 [Nitrospirae bacterium]|nr:Major facilitator superfamily 1 [Nitrospirota bacterium]